MPERRVFNMALAGRNRTDHHLAGVHPDAGFDRRVASRTQLRRVAAHLVLQPEPRIKRALWVVFVGYWRAKQGEDAVAGGLRYITAVMMDRIHHQLERRIDQATRLLR